MKIDWFTFLAQIANFLILIFLLKRFLYRPILRAMEARESAIAARISEATEREEEAERRAGELRLKQQELEENAQAMLKQARSEAENRRTELVAEARTEVEETRREWYAALRREQEDFLTELRTRVGAELHDAVRRALLSLADSELEERIVRTFVRRLTASRETGTAVRDALNQSNGRCTLSSSFELSDAMRGMIEEALADHYSAPLHVDYEVVVDQLCGIEWRAEGVKVEWSLRRYLQELERNLAGALRDSTPDADERRGNGNNRNREEASEE